MTSKSVIIIGGGLAGLSAAVALAEAGWRVRLFEQRPFLGGRATSYVLPDGERVDNCQHVTFECCSNLADFYRRAGAESKIRFYDGLVLVDPEGRRGVLRASAGWPAPLHMLPSFLRFSALALRDKLAIARAMFDIVRSGGQPTDIAEQTEAPGISMLEWLRRRRQTPAAMARFWRAVLVSALSEELDRIDAHYGIAVLWKAVLSNRTGYRMGVPGVPLADLYDGCRAAIEGKGGEVLLRTPARTVRIENGTVAGIGFDGREEKADAYVIAVPHTAIAGLLPEDVRRSSAALRGLRNLRDAPITGVHLWFDRRVMNEPFMTLLDTTTQWIFNKTLLYRNPNGADPSVSAGQYLQLVISASYDLLERPRQEIIDLCLREARQALPAAREAQLVKAMVIKEAAATFSPEPGCDRWRPKQETPIGKLFLAGDWTETGWPATMEGAVRSGYLAAEAILARDGNPRQLVRADLPVKGLARLWSRG